MVFLASSSLFTFTYSQTKLIFSQKLKIKYFFHHGVLLESIFRELIFSSKGAFK